MENTRLVTEIAELKRELSRCQAQLSNQAVMGRLYITPTAGGFICKDEFERYGVESPTREQALGSFVSDFWSELGLEVMGL